ncbi:CHASE2 and HATPase_c domain-containing protein [Sphingobium sp. DEHP117]|uniref:CHASE2 domain-containing protein n=1 Tax=Sphingobium sp. DEHP117 TaxID=2993436 RepID=UPI0027D663D3|nr:CHASE2 domain-containing protein [Sphingobium sp. DEHP117]MDQ4421357.1 CHASE2 and HATPase_c domain-containing protein [Sphingobium sp. DEHP117]
MKSRRLWLEWLLIGLVASLTLYLGERAGLFERAERLLYDATAPLRAAPPDDAIVIVAIDHASLEQVGRWPWPRDVHARMLARLQAAGAKAILYDVLFVEASPHDAALASAMREGPPVFLPVLFDIPGPNGAPYAVEQPQPALAKAAAGVGIVNLELDGDGRARRVEMKARDGAHWLPALAELAYREMRKRPSPAYPDERAATPSVYVPFNPTGSFRTIGFAQLLNGETPTALLKGKTVIVGATATGLSDHYAVPGSADLMPGAEVQANLLSSLLNDRLITPVSRDWGTAWSLVPLWLLMLAYWRLLPTQALVVTFTLAGALVVGSIAALAWTGHWVSPVAALIGIAIVYPLWSWRRLSAVTHFIDTQVEALLAQSELSRAMLGGQGGDSIARRTERLTQIIALMQRNAAERQEMLQFLSHDMRGPQAAIIALLDSENAGESPEQRRTTRARIRRHAETTLALADNFVQLARLESQPPECVPVDVGDAMAQAIDLIWPQAQPHGVRLDRSAMDGVECWVLGEDATLVRAFTNLLANAVQASPGGGVIRCALSREGDFALACVSDDGPGLPPERQANPFARFGYSGAASGVRGSGLGLAFVAAAARQCGGEALYAQGPSGGAQFTLRLPVWEEDEA